MAEPAAAEPASAVCVAVAAAAGAWAAVVVVGLREDGAAEGTCGGWVGAQARCAAGHPSEEMLTLCVYVCVYSCDTLRSWAPFRGDADPVCVRMCVLM